MSVIDEVLDGLDSLKSRNPSSVVDMLCKIHDNKGAGIASMLGIATELADQVGSRQQATSQPVNDDPFPDFAGEQLSFSKNKTHPEAKNTPLKRESFMFALEETLLSYQELLEKHNRDFDAIHAQNKAGNIENEDQTIARLRAAQLALLKYPIAGQAIYAALIREGRSFAKTEQGGLLKQQLARSPVVAKARTLFEGLSGGMLSEHNSELPSTYIDGFLDALDRDLEGVLSDLGDVSDTL